MAHSITIGGYDIEVHALSAGDSEILASFGDGEDLFAFLEKELDLLRHTPFSDEDKSSQLRVTSVEKLGPRTLFAQLKTGDFGISAEGRRKADDKMMYERTPDIVELIPLYVMFYIPKKSKHGVLVVQRIGLRSPYTTIASYLTKRFRDAYDDHRLGFARFVPQSLLSILSDGLVRGLSFRLHKLPKDLTTAIAKFGNAVDMKHATIEVRPSRHRSFTLSTPLKSLLANPTKVGGISVPSLFGEEADVTMTIDHDGHRHRVSMSSPEDAAPYLDITEEVGELVGGHPSAKAVALQMFAHVVDICGGLGIDPPKKQ